MKTKVGDKIEIVMPDEESLKRGVKLGQIGKVTEEYEFGCFAKNPLWGETIVGFWNEEFEVLNKSEGLNDD